MIFLCWLLLAVGYSVCGSLIVPRSTIEKYSLTPKDWQYWLGHFLFFSIPLSWLFGVESSPVAILTGVALFVIGGALRIWAMVSNPYFLPSIEVPVRIITGGAYRWKWLRHPGYVALSLMASGTYLIAGHKASAIPLSCYLILLLIRARLENRILSVEDAP